MIFLGVGHLYLVDSIMNTSYILFSSFQLNCSKECKFFHLHFAFENSGNYVDVQTEEIFVL